MSGATYEGRPGILAVRGLRASTGRGRREVALLRGMSFTVGEGELHALVGESGSGKSLTALAVMGLLPDGVRATGGRIWFENRDLLADGEAAWRRVRGRRISIVFQDPLSALNPYLTVGAQVQESVTLHHRLEGRKARVRMIELLEEVGLQEPERRARFHPHELSGGQRQRIMIAMALAGDPALLIADEPTTALDVTVQARVLALFRDLASRRGMSVLLITHDIAVVSEVADRVSVAYAGRVVEDGPVRDVLSNPLHPYTRALLKAIPDPRGPYKQPLEAIPGMPPDPAYLPGGCPFHLRCSARIERCETEDPVFRHANADHGAACLLDLGPTGEGEA